MLLEAVKGVLPLSPPTSQLLAFQGMASFSLLQKSGTSDATLEYFTVECEYIIFDRPEPKYEC